MTQISTFNSLSRSDSICLIREKITSDVCHEVKWKLKRLQIFERNLKWFWSDVTNLLSFTSDFRSVSNSFRFFFTFTETNSIISSRSHEGEKVSSSRCLDVVWRSSSHRVYMLLFLLSSIYLSFVCEINETRIRKESSSAHKNSNKMRSRNLIRRVLTTNVETCKWEEKMSRVLNFYIHLPTYSEFGTFCK